MRNTRYALLAGTMLLPGVALPHWSAAAPLSVSATQGPIILAQAPVDPKEKDKAKQLPKGVQPKGVQPKGAPQAVAPPAPPQPPTLPQQKVMPPTGTQQGLQNVQPPAGAAGLPKGAPGGATTLQSVPPKIQPQQNLQPPTGAAGLPKGPPATTLQSVPPKIQPQQNLQPPAGAAGLPKGPGAQGLQNVQPPPGPQQGLQNVQPPAGAAGLPKGPPGGATTLQGVPPKIQPQQNLQPPAGTVDLPKGPAGLQKPLPGQPGQITGTPQNPQVLQQQKQILQPQGIGTVDALRSQRREHVEGKTVIIKEPGNRVIVRENGRAFIRHDETQRFSIWGKPRIEHRGPEQYAYITRPGGYQVITV